MVREIIFMKKINWLHTFDLNIPGGGSFMLELFNQLTNQNRVCIHLQYINKISLTSNFLSFIFKNRNRFKDEIIHTQYGAGNSFVCLFIKSKTKIMSLRGSDTYLMNKGGLFQVLRSYIAVFLSMISIRYYDHVIVMSEAMKRKIGMVHYRKKFT